MAHRTLAYLPKPDTKGSTADDKRELYYRALNFAIKPLVDLVERLFILTVELPSCA